MKSFFFISFLLFVSVQNTIPQDLSKVYGEITDYELKMTTYSNDSQAGAVVLYDKGLSHFVGSRGVNFDVIFQRLTKIKILKDTGVSYATFSIPYFHEGTMTETIEGLYATTYNLENGEVKKTSVNPTGFYDEKLNEYWDVRKFTMPDVKPGSVIEVRYNIRSPYLMNLHDWEFQWDIPVISSEYTTRMVPFYEYTYILQGSNHLDTMTAVKDNSYPRSISKPGSSQSLRYVDMVYSFGMQNIPAYNDNEFVSSRNDYIIKIDFQLSKVHLLGRNKRSIISTWPELIKGLLDEEIYGEYLSRSGSQLKSVIGNTKDSGKTTIELYNEIMSYVKNNFEWNGSTGKYVTKSADSFVKDKEGNSAEINLFATGLLQAAGIEATPLLISTRRNGKIKSDYPFLHFFNNVIVAALIGDEYILGDATEPLLANNRIPERCINETGLLIKKGEPIWLSLQPIQPSTTLTIMELSVGETETEAAFQKSITEFEAYDMRQNITFNKEYLTDYIRRRNYSNYNEDVEALNLQDPAKPVVIKYTALDKTETISGKIFVAPFLKESDLINPLTQKTRTQPVDFVYPVVRTFSSIIKIPDGYDVEFLPAFPLVDNPLFNLSYTAERKENVIQVQMKYNFKLGVYKASDYNALKQHFNDIIRYSSAKIILKKL
jgi:hypothetical protein